MTQLGEKIAIIPPPPKEKKPDEEKKKPISLRMSLFFDGTMNNRINIEAREKDKEAFKKYGKKGSSYDNGRTNVAIMEGHVEETAKGYEFFNCEYIEGIGTFNEKKDSKYVGGGMGGGSSGVVDRAELGVDKVFQWVLNSGNVDKSEHEITKLTIDVFGFSRGSAAARYAIFLLLKHRNRAIQQRLENFGYIFAESSVEVGFAGLYDTVLSYYLSQWSKKTNNRLEQKSARLANKVIHLAAADEHRKNFPLHNIKAAKSKGGEEYFLPGVHSDVGGSYNQADEEKIRKAEEELAEKKHLEAKDKKKMGDLVMVCDSEGETLVNQDSTWAHDIPEKIRADKQYLIDQGWFKEVDNTGCENPENQIWVELDIDEFDELDTEAYLYIRRKKIKTGYSNIPLKVMADFARGNEGKLSINTKLEDRADLVIEQSGLKKLEALIKDYIGSTSHSKPDDWLNNEMITKYRNEHFHFSATSGAANGPRIKKGKRKRFIYDA